MLKIEPRTYELLEEEEVFRNVKCYLKVQEGSKALRIFYEDEQVGCAFKGWIEYAVDTLVETPKGVIGRPVKRSGEDTVIVFIEPLPKLRLREIETDRDFIEEVLNICKELFKERKIGLEDICYKIEHFIAIFSRGERYEMIVAKGDKLVYTSSDLTYVISPPNRVILILSGSVLISSKDKLVYRGSKKTFVAML